jgi:hypothetical protein
MQPSGLSPQAGLSWKCTDDDDDDDGKINNVPQLGCKPLGGLPEHNQHKLQGELTSNARTRRGRCFGV